MLDYHVHTTQSADCVTPIQASCEAAIARGVREIAFTDHIEHEPADMSFGFFDYTTYLDDLERARDRFGDRLTILAGAEVDFNVGIADQVEAFLAAHRFDFVIGSVHYGDEGQIIFPEYFANRTIDDVMLPYLENVHAAAQTGWFDTIGHLDLPKRYAPLTAGPYDPWRYHAGFRDIFRAMMGTGTLFEINTSGIRQAPRTSMPGPQVVSMFVQSGGTAVTLGSDSHVPETIAAGYGETLSMLRICGVTGIATFRERRRTDVPLDSVPGTVRARGMGDGVAIA